MWQRLCAVLEADVLLEDPDYATEELRFKNRDRLNDVLATILSRRTSGEWIEALNDAGVPCGPIYDIDEVFADPQVRHLGMAASVSHPVLGAIEVVNNPVSKSESPEVTYTASPERGEHTEAVLAEYGYSPEEIESLRGDGTI